MERVWLEGLGGGKPEIALVFPGPRRIGAENLGLHSAFRGLNRLSFTDIFFTDNPRGIRSGKPLYEFSLIFFSFSYEPDYLPALRFLKAEGIELDRRRRGFHLLFAGGIAPSANPFPLWHTFDAVLVGEAEAIIPFLETGIYEERQSFLSYLSERAWAWLPDQKEDAERARLPDMTRSDAFSAFVERDSFFKGEFLVEVSRGCPNRCRFCLLGFSSLPPRFLPGEIVLDLLGQLPVGLTRQVALVGSAVAEHPEIREILAGSPQHLILNPTSLNASALEPELLALLARRGAKTLTLAPEVASDSLRMSLNKPFGNERILDVARWARDVGFGSLKLYYMIGLPKETQEDVRAISDQVSEIKRVFKRRVRATVSPFVPKAGTPFYRARFLSEEDYKKRVSLINVPKDVLLKVHGYRKAREEAILSRGDQSVSAALLVAAQEDISLASGLKKAGAIPSLYLDDPGYPLSAPFLRVSSGVSRDFLDAEWRRAMDDEPTPPCFPGCGECGVC
ncbi:MAG: B12-binding domain-containing radical SAM protein [candidate division WOR-3 bacterium]